LRRVLQVKQLDQGVGGSVAAPNDLAQQSCGFAMILAARAAAERGAASRVGGRDSRKDRQRRGDAAGRWDLLFDGCELGDLQRLLRVVEPGACVRSQGWVRPLRFVTLGRPPAARRASGRRR
jgi:hypothetical protein